MSSSTTGVHEHAAFKTCPPCCFLSPEMRFEKIHRELTPKSHLRSSARATDVGTHVGTSHELTASYSRHLSAFSRVTRLRLLQLSCGEPCGVRNADVGLLPVFLTHARARTRAHARKHTRTHAQPIHPRTRPHTRTHTHTPTHACAHRHTHTHTHTHTRFGFSTHRLALALALALASLC